MAHFPYNPPTWGGKPCNDYVLQVFEELELRGTLSLTNEKYFYTFGASGSDIQLDGGDDHQAVLQFKRDGGAFLYAMHCAGLVSNHFVYVNNEKVNPGSHVDLSNGDDFWFGKKSKSTYRLQISHSSYSLIEEISVIFRDYTFLSRSEDLLLAKFRFSNSHYVDRERVTFQIFKDSNEAIQLNNTLLKYKGDHIAYPYTVQVNNDISYLLYRMPLKDFGSWIGSFGKVSWYDHNVINFIRDVLQGLLFLYHTHKRGHGNLLSGILVTEDNRALLTNLSSNIIGYETYMRKDVLDLARMVNIISKLHKESQSTEIPLKVSEFLKLLKHMLGTDPFNVENLYWFTCNPIYWRTEEVIRFYMNLNDVYDTLNLKTYNYGFVTTLRFSRLAKWQDRIKEETVLSVIFDSSHYPDEPSIIHFVRNVLLHYKETYESIYELGQDVSDEDIIEDLHMTFPSLCVDLFDMMHKHVMNGHLNLSSVLKFLNEKVTLERHCYDPGPSAP